jgi:GAF domain-containing protein
MTFLLDDAPESHPSHTSRVIDFRPLTTLLDRLRGLGSSRVLEEVLVLVMDSAIDATGAERGFIMLANSKGELEFKVARARGRVTLSGGSFATSQKIPQEVFETGRERIVADLRESDVAGHHLGTVALGIRHVLCTPLRVVRYLEQSSSDIEQRPIGVLYLDSREKGRLMSEAARSALKAVAGEAASAIESARLYREATEKARIERELLLAAEIQRALLPEAMQSGPHFDVAAASIPCRSIGGDFLTISISPTAASASHSAMSQARGRQRHS